MKKRNPGKIKAKHRSKLPAGGEGDSAARLKRKMQKALALVDYYNNLGHRKICSEEELKEVKSKMMFTQKQILRLCLESKKMVKDAE